MTEALQVAAIFSIILIMLGVISFKLQAESKKKIKELKEENNKVVSHRKSSEVRLGRMAEQFAPLIEDYPYDSNKFRFIGDPIDGLQVSDDALIIIEFKTGKARLTKSQQHIKQLVNKGKVRFETFRMDEAGGSIKVEAGMINSKLQNQNN